VEASTTSTNLQQILIRRIDMSLISIRDLAQSRELDRQAMSAVRGGKFEGSAIQVNPQVTIGISQNISIAQNFDIDILNNADLSGAELDFKMDLSPIATAVNFA
jgi:hypothetical protein